MLFLKTSSSPQEPSSEPQTEIYGQSPHQPLTTFDGVAARRPQGCERYYTIYYMQSCLAISRLCRASCSLQYLEHTSSLRDRLYRRLGVQDRSHKAGYRTAGSPPKKDYRTGPWKGSWHTSSLSSFIVSSAARLAALPTPDSCNA